MCLTLISIIIVKLLSLYISYYFSFYFLKVSTFHGETFQENKILRDRKRNEITTIFRYSKKLNKYDIVKIIKGLSVKEVDF